MGKHKLTPELMDIIAERFKALGEPARLQILDALRDGEATVTELVDATGLGQANVSKHLGLLHGLGFVTPTPALGAGAAVSSRAGKRGCTSTTASPTATSSACAI